MTRKREKWAGAVTRKLITMTAEELSKHRPVWLRSTFLRIARGNTLFCGVSSELYQGGKGIGLSSSGVQQGTPDTWDFETFAESVFCRYSEVWVPQPVRSDRLELYGLSLKLFVSPNGMDPRDILAVHAEFSLSGHGEKVKLKKSPHLHLDWADPPLPKCHFAMNLANLNNVVSNRNALGAALSNLVFILGVDVLPRFDSYCKGTPDWASD